VITQVIAVPKARMIELKDQILDDPKFIAISIIDPEPAFPVFEEDTSRIITVRFSDLTPGPFFHGHFDFSRETFCSTEQANQIITHVLMHANTDEEKVLIVNCSAGICRSGAVVTWAFKHSEMKDTDFIQKNPTILPNEWVFWKLIEAEMSLPAKPVSRRRLIQEIF
jgi:predicted protein tyrosine phosphatase